FLGDLARFSGTFRVQQLKDEEVGRAEAHGPPSFPRAGVRRSHDAGERDEQLPLLIPWFGSKPLIHDGRYSAIGTRHAKPPRCGTSFRNLTEIEDRDPQKALTADVGAISWGRLSS